jgi:hypothetical protein
MKPVLRKKDFRALGYRRFVHKGYVWVADEEAARLLAEIDDWSPQALAGRKGWTSWEKRRHELYLVQGRAGKYLIKTYPPKESGSAGWFRSRRIGRATKEFRSSVAAYLKGIPTPLPAALGEKKEDRRWGIIVYPFLEETYGLDRLYAGEGFKLDARERHLVEKKVGRLMRKFIDLGMYPRYMKFDHFLIKREGERLQVYWIDLERTKFTRFFKRTRLLRTVGKVLATLEWFRISGARVNRASMARIGQAFLQGDSSERPDKRSRRAAIRAAEEFWNRRHLSQKKAPVVTVIESLVGLSE